MRKVLIILVFLQLISPNAAGAAGEPAIESGSAVVLEAQSGQVLFEKNAEEKKFPASLTKVATAIYAIEKGNLDDIVTVSEDAREADGTRVYLEAGEQVPLRKLVEGLLINSGNDAGVAIAEHLGGSVGQFAEDLTRYAAEIGATGTTFKNPHGLFDPSHQTTARDLALITQHAMKNAEFRRIFGTKELKWTGQSWDTTLFTHHKLLREMPYDGVTGGKTGYVDESGHTLVTSAERGGTSLIVVTLEGASQRVAYGDTAALLDYAFANFKTEVMPAGTEIPMAKKAYKTKREIYYTRPASQNVTMEMAADGTLVISGENRQPVASIKLENFKKETVKPAEKVGREKGASWGTLMLLPGTILGLLAVGATILQRNRRRAIRQSRGTFGA